jgi:DNA-binding IclR family transcriptional regulator
LNGTANGQAALALLDAEAQAALGRFSPEVADGLRHAITEIRGTGIAFERGERTPWISAATVARCAVGDNVIAISALRAAADSPTWSR